MIFINTDLIFVFDMYVDISRLKIVIDNYKINLKFATEL